MILLWGVMADGPLVAVQAALNRRGAPIFLLDQQRTAETSIQLELGADRLRGEIVVGEARCALEDVRGIYARPYATRGLLDPEPAEALSIHADDVEMIIHAFLEVTSACLVNPAAAMATNSSKPYQAALIAAQGFRVPETLVTTDPAAAADFRAHHGEVIYKSVSGERSIVSRLTDRHAERIADIAWCPTQFQAHVPGRDIRVHVVGDRHFACEIASDADDYRYAHRQDLGLSITETDLPDAVAARCLDLSRALRLPLAGIDLRRTPDGEWYCFEVNPSPAFTYYEGATGLPIADAVANLLLGLREGGSRRRG